MMAMARAAGDPNVEVGGSRVRMVIRLMIALMAVTVAINVGVAGGEPSRQPTHGPPRAELEAACQTSNPFVAVACVDAVIVFRDTPGDEPRYVFGRTTSSDRSDVGAIWGLAYSHRENAVYAAAAHRRGKAFGPGGPGAIYRIDLATGEVSQPITVPNAGSDHHLPDARGSDTPARYWAGKTSLGDIDLDEREGELFATNLEDRRIYRFSVPDGQLIGSFEHGAAGEAWSEDARPWGLAAKGAVIYHGVVNSAESSRRDALLEAVVYESQVDGSGMRTVFRVPLSHPRGRFHLLAELRSANWHAWQNLTLNRQIITFPMPILSDIDIDASGGLVLGLKDRLGDMVHPSAIIIGRQGQLPIPEQGVDAGVALGELLYAPSSVDGWSAPDAARFHASDANGSTWLQGGLTTIGITDVIVAGATRYTRGGQGPSRDEFFVGEAIANWRSPRSPDVNRHEHACAIPTNPRPLAAAGRLAHAASLTRPFADNELGVEIPESPGDVELLCAPTVHPTPSPSPTPVISPTPSATRTPSSTPTVTPVPTDTATPSPTTMPSPTRVPGPVYLPIAVSEPPCLPIRPILDVILILDASTSMADLTRAGRPKIDAAIAAARDFVARLALAANGDHAALVAFNVAATLEAPLTFDRAALDAALDGIALAQFTRIDLGLDAAAAELASGRRRPGATAAVILLTDGRSNPVPVSEAERAAEAVKATGARLFTIGLGQDLDADALRRMASRPADYFEAPDGEDLAAIYEVIAAALPCPPYAHWPRPAADTAKPASGNPTGAHGLTKPSRRRVIRE